MFFARTRLSWILLLAVLITSGCYVSSQDPSEDFADGKAPIALDAVANPQPKTNASKIIDSKSSVTVAVIDNGVDYLHPFLVDKIRYQVDGGKIVGAGWDFFGQDPWPHPNLVEASTFAFGAAITADNKIENSVADPLAELDRLNSKFMAMLSKKMGGNNLFHKINADSFHILGAVSLLIDKATLLQDYKRAKGANQTLKPKGAPQIAATLTEGALRTIRDEEWRLGARTSGFPRGVSVENFAMIDGFDSFMAELEKVYDAFNKEVNFDQQLASYVKYRTAELDRSETGDSDDAKVKKFASELYSRWFKVRYNYIGEDPAWAVAAHFCDFLSNDEYSKLRSSGTSENEKSSIVFSTLNRVYSDVEKVANLKLSSPQVGAPEKRFTIQPMLETLSNYKAWVYRILADRGPSLLYCDPKVWSGQNYKYAQQYADFAKRSNHPYLYPTSSTQSHGTHVSGIILSQEPDAKVLPVRVITENRLTTVGFDKKIQERIFGELQRWLAIPVIREAISQRLAPYIQNGEDLAAVVKGALPAIYEQNKLSFIFFEQIRDAIKYVGQHKIKVANMSLGWEYNAPIDGTAVNQAAALSNDLLYVIFEFFKYSIGETIQTSAPNTLFVVASGNNGAALNDVTKSGLPCDISSPFLKPFEEKRAVQVPNNHISNILCVGSLNSMDQVSSFTNVLIQTSVPWVLSYGEAIESSIKTEDCSGVKDAVARTIGSDPSIGMSASQLESLLWSSPSSPQRNGHKTVQDNEVLAKANARLAMENLLVSSLNDLAKSHACIIGSGAPHVKMSGTSMATPEVTGQTAALLSRKLKAVGITEQEAYDDSRFAPAVLIRELMEQAPRVGDGSRIDEVKKLIATRRYAGPMGKFDITFADLGKSAGNGSTMPSVIVVPKKP